MDAALRRDAVGPWDLALRLGLRERSGFGDILLLRPSCFHGGLRYLEYWEVRLVAVQALI